MAALLLGGVNFMYIVNHKEDMKHRRIISFDPGKTNMAISAVELRNSTPVILANAIMECPVDNLNKGFRDSLAMFLAETEGWTSEFKPDAMIAERFQSRGGRTGTTGESVGIMLGALCVHYMHLPMRLITAAMWKNEFQREHGKLDQVYKRCMTTPHQLDSTLIGFYGLSTGLGIKLTYTVDEVIEQIERTSRTELHKRRARK